MSPRHALLRAPTGAFLLLLVLAPAVLGHAELDTISPADKSSGPSPTEIVGTFVQNLDPAKSNFRVVSAANTVVAEGGKVDPAAPRRMTLALSPLPPGPYTIRWTTFSTEDDELAHGETTFTVIAATPVPSSSPTTSVAPSASAAASVAPSLIPSPTAAPSAAPAPTASTTDAVIPVIAALIVLGALGLWLLRSRSRRAG